MTGVKVFDFAPYWRERWAFDARLHLWSTLQPDVDYRPVAFVGDRTHRGNPKPPDLPPPPEGVETVTVTLDAPDDWAREQQQRDAAREYVSVAAFGATDVAPDDLILLCDADEIVDPRRLPDILEATRYGPVKLAMRLWYYGTRWRAHDWWTHPGACRAKDLPPHPSNRLRLSGYPAIADAGWHLSWQGDDSDRAAKVAAFAHSEFDNPAAREHLAVAAAQGLDPHGSPLVDDEMTGPLADFLGAVNAR